jgi:hypothetical protein
VIRLILKFTTKNLLEKGADPLFGGQEMDIRYQLRQKLEDFYGGVECQTYPDS